MKLMCLESGTCLGWHSLTEYLPSLEIILRPQGYLKEDSTSCVVPVLEHRSEIKMFSTSSLSHPPQAYFCLSGIVKECGRFNSSCA